MSQTRTWSVIEVVSGTCIKFMAAMALWPLVMTPFFGLEITLSTNFLVTCIFAANSMIMSYLIRRFFNAKAG